MRGLLHFISRISGLLHPEWDLHLGPGTTVPRREEGPSGWEIEGERLLSLKPPVGCGNLRVAALGRSDLGGAVLSSVQAERLHGCLARSSDWGDVRIGTMDLCDLEGAHLARFQADRVMACSFREARLEHGEIRLMTLVDLADARLEDVRIGEASACDFTGAVLERCDLVGADLRGSVFRRTHLKGTDPTRARVEGADFRGVRGLDRATRRRLLVAGARFRSGAWWRVLGRLMPGADPLRIEAVAFGTQLLLTGLAGILCLLALYAVIRPPPVLPVPELPEPRARSISPVDVERTQQSLARLREGLARAHEEMVRNGARTAEWPSMSDFQQNQYDIDGDGPGEARARIVPGGLGDNLLTECVGVVLPYCNEIPTQETLSAVEADWHYCDLTGRVHASAGYSGLATLDW